jgi:hypothetical protein
MTNRTEAENRLFSAAELELVTATRDPEIGLAPTEELKSVARRLRDAHAKARDIAERQQREIRGKAEPHGARPAVDNTGTLAKAQALSEALQRLEAELLRRSEAEAATSS